MILLWLTLSVLLAALIARYNESNKLFWILFTSFVVGVAGGHLYMKATSTGHSKECCVKVLPMQGTPMSVANAIVTTDNGVLSTSTSVPEPASKDLSNKHVPTDTTTVSKCCAETHTPPPNAKTTKVCTDTTTHLD